MKNLIGAQRLWKIIMKYGIAVQPRSIIRRVKSTGEASPLKPYYDKKSLVICVAAQRRFIEVGFFVIPNHSSVIEDSLKFLLSRKVSPYKGYLEGIVDFIKLPHKLS